MSSGALPRGSDMREGLDGNKFHTILGPDSRTDDSRSQGHWFESQYWAVSEITVSL